MNFFERQNAARRQSKRLLLLFLFALFAIVAAVDLVLLLAFGFSAEEAPSPASVTTAPVVASLVTLAVIGGALGIFVSFRTNTSYARWWEGRQLWGRMVNSSRQLALQLSANLVIEDEGERRRTLTRLLYRHGAYVHALRAALREQPALEDEELRALLAPDELDGLKGVWDVPCALQCIPQGLHHKKRAFSLTN